MAHYGLLCPDDSGHLLSVGGLGSELVRRGHRVTLLGGLRSAPLAEELNLAFYELPVDNVPWRPGWILPALYSVFGAGWHARLRDWMRWQATMLFQLVPPALKELAVDGLILDQQYSAAGTIAEHHDLPFVTVCSALPWNEDATVPPPFTHWDGAQSHRARLRNRIGYTAWRWHIQPVLKIINTYRRAWKLPPWKHIDESYSRLAQISQLCRELDFPRQSLPDVFHYVGPLTTNRSYRDGEFPWERLDGRRLIFASVGTVEDTRNLPTVRRILAACADLDAQLVLSLGTWTGGGSDLDQLGKISGDPVIVDYVPQLAILERASLLITHAGHNTANESLSRGVPMVALPRAADQPGVASRVVNAGAGLRGSFQKSSAPEIRRLIERVLTEETFSHRARQLQQAMVSAGEVRRAADITLQALTTGQPVDRQDGAALATQPAPLPAS